MPYASNDELPPEVRKAYSGRCQTVFREAFNGHDGSEESKFKVAHTAARKCMESTMTHQPMKAEQISSSKWRVLAIPFGGPFRGKDLDGEFFSPNTDIKPDWFDRRPLVWHHNLDKTIPDPVLGTADDLEEKPDGWWTTVWLNRSNQYWAAVNELLASGKIYGSSGSLPNFVRVDRKSGEILVWPYIEQTLTPTPSNFYSVVVPAKAVDHFAEADIDLSPALRDAWVAPSDLDSPPADLPVDLPDEGGDAAATQEAPSNPDRDRVVRKLAAFVPRLEKFKNL